MKIHLGVSSLVFTIFIEVNIVQSKVLLNDNYYISQLEDSLIGFDEKVFEMEDRIGNFTQQKEDKWSECFMISLYIGFGPLVKFI